MPPGIAKRQGVSRETVREMRAQGLSDEAIEAKLAAGRAKRELKSEPAAPPVTKVPEGEAGKTELQRTLEEAEIAKAQRHILRTRKEAEGLVDAGAVFRAQQARAAQERDALLAWPARIAGPLAARLGCPEPLLREELSKSVRAYLNERTQPNADSAAA